MKARSAAAEWLALLRAPNLFTIPGDIIAGSVLALGSAWFGSSRDTLLLTASSLLIYGAGLILNDWFDIDSDRKARPDRPLASDKVAPSTALAVAALMITSGAGLSACVGTNSLVVAIILIVLVIAYNGPARRVPVLGFVTMGLCRGMNLLLGASVIFPRYSSVVLIAAAAETCYVCLVTAAAAKETEAVPSVALRRVIPAGLLAGLAFLTMVSGPSLHGAAGCALVIAVVSSVVVRVGQVTSPVDIQKKIGALIGLLIPLQAAFILAGTPKTPVLVPAIIVYAMWPLSYIVRRAIKGS